MKTAEELFDANKRYNDGSFRGYALRKTDFISALTDYKQSIIGLIDDMIELYQDHYRARQSLSELKQKIEQL